MEKNSYERRIYESLDDKTPVLRYISKIKGKQNSCKVLKWFHKCQILVSTSSPVVNQCGISNLPAASEIVTEVLGRERERAFERERDQMNIMERKKGIDTSGSNNLVPIVPRWWSLCGEHCSEYRSPFYAQVVYQRVVQKASTKKQHGGLGPFWDYLACIETWRRKQPWCAGGRFQWRNVKL